MGKYSAWIYASIGLVLTLGVLGLGQVNELTAMRVLAKACDYYESKGVDDICRSPFVENLDLKKCEKQLYIVETNNNRCSDVIISGGGGKRFYSKFAYAWSEEVRLSCDYDYVGGCE